MYSYLFALTNYDHLAQVNMIQTFKLCWTSKRNTLEL